jgi:hypothetical protein
MEKHTLIDSAIERRNHYQGRMAENMTNIIYFGKRKANLISQRNKSKVDSEARAELNKQIVSAEGAIATGKDNIEQDQMLVDSFDELLKSFKKGKKK